MHSIRHFTISSSSLNRMNSTLRDRSTLSINAINKSSCNQNSFLQPSIKFSQFKDSPTSQNDYSILLMIIQHAHQKYLKESSVKQRSSKNSIKQKMNGSSHEQTFGKAKTINAFNILKILVSFKQLFAHTPQRIYKLIMYIGKQYNPQTLIQWKKAVEKLKIKSFEKTTNFAQEVNYVNNQSTLKDDNFDESLNKQNNSLQLNTLFKTATYQKYQNKRQKNSFLNFNLLIKNQQAENQMMKAYKNQTKSNKSKSRSLSKQKSKQKIKQKKQQSSKTKNSNEKQNKKFEDHFKMNFHNDKVNLQHYISFEPGSKQFLQENQIQQQNYSNNQICQLNYKKKRTQFELVQNQKEKYCQNLYKINKNNASRSATMIDSPYSYSHVAPYQSTNPNTQFHTQQNSRVYSYSYNNIPKEKSIQRLHKKNSANNFEKKNSNNKISSVNDEKSIIHKLDLTSKQQNDCEPIMNYKIYQNYCSNCQNCQKNIQADQKNNNSNQFYNNLQSNSQRIHSNNCQKNLKQSHISKKTCNNSQNLHKMYLEDQQKELKESQFFNISREEWVSMNERATIFYQINMKFKAYSSLLANFQAFQYYKTLKNKAQIFFNSNLQFKTFQVLKNYVNSIKQQKVEQNKALKYYQNRRTKKCFDILKLYNEIKLQQEQSQKKLKINLQKFNPINYQFLLGLIFSQKEDKQIFLQSFGNISENNLLNQSLDIQKKVDLLSKTQKYQKIYQIFKCFGANITLNKQVIQNLFQFYHKSIMKKTFSILKTYQQEKNRCILTYTNNLTLKTFSILKKRYQKMSSYKKKVQIGNQINQKNMMLKVFKVLVQITYANKLFSKRCAFISAKQVQNLKRNAIKLWNTQLKNLLNQKQKKRNQVKQAISKLKKCIFSICFNVMKNIAKAQRRQIQTISEYRALYIQKKVISHFKRLIESKKKYFQLRLKKQNQFKQEIMKKWFKYSTFNSKLKNTQKIITKLILKQNLCPLLKRCIKNNLLQKQNNKITLSSCFQQLKLNYVKNSNLRNFYQSQIIQFLGLGWKRQFILFFKTDYFQSLKLKRDIIQNNNVLNLNTILTQNSMRKAIQTLVAYQKDQKQFKQKELKLIQYLKIGKQRKFQFVQQCKKQNKIIKLQKQLKSLLKNKISNQLVKSIKVKCLQIKTKRLQNYLKNKRFEILLQNNKLQKKQIIKKQLLSQKFYIQKRQTIFLLTLTQEFIQLTKNKQELQKILHLSRKNLIIKTINENVKESRIIKQKQQIISKKHFYCESKNKYSCEKSFKNKQILLRTFLKQIFNKQFLNNLITFKRQQIVSDTLQNKIVFLHKKIVFMRFTDSFVFSLIKKKHQFMAFKFRSIKLQELAFRVFQRNFILGYSENKVPIKVKDNIRKNSVQLQKIGYQPTDYC